MSGRFVEPGHRKLHREQARECTEQMHRARWGHSRATDLHQDTEGEQASRIDPRLAAVRREPACAV